MFALPGSSRQTSVCWKCSACERRLFAPITSQGAHRPANYMWLSKFHTYMTITKLKHTATGSHPKSRKFANTRTIEQSETMHRKCKRLWECVELNSTPTIRLHVVVFSQAHEQVHFYLLNLVTVRLMVVQVAKLTLQHSVEMIRHDLP
jgi:hypothetical protein